MTVYLAIPPDRLRTCLGFVRGFIGLALDGITAVPARPAHRVAFFLDEFGQLGRMDRLADGITLLRGYGAQLWVFVQDLSQLKAVYPRWQSFLANTSQQFFGTADYDTARYLSGALGQQTIAFETQSSSTSDQGLTKPGSVSASIGEHVGCPVAAEPSVHFGPELLHTGLNPDEAVVPETGTNPNGTEKVSHANAPLGLTSMEQ